MTVETFGILGDGSPVDHVVLKSGGLSLDVIGLGAAIRDMTLKTPSGTVPLVLGLDTLDHYLNYSPSMGIVAGRFANRIALGRFSLDGKSYQLPQNERGVSHLHGGGKTGFGMRPWTVTKADDRSATFRIVSEDGDQGYPGKVVAEVTYALTDERTVTIDLVATTDAPTIINLATHSYFNLDGEGDILNHRLEIPAESYLPVDGHLIPTGEIARVAGTPFDFRVARPVDYRIDGQPFVYDHNFCVDTKRAATPRLMARLSGAKRGISMEVHSTEPGVQFYDGSSLHCPVMGSHGRHFAARSGLCLEPQIFPDTPNQPQFGSAVLRPGETYHQVTVYKLSVA